MQEVIANLGVPIASVVGMAFYFVQKDKANREDINKIMENLMEDNRCDRELYRETIDKFDMKLDKFAFALESNNSRLAVIEEDIKSIKERVNLEEGENK